MTIVFVLIPVGLILVAVAVWAFFWAVGSGQYEDLETPAMRILLDDDSALPAGADGASPARADDDSAPPTGADDDSAPPARADGEKAAGGPAPGRRDPHRDRAARV